MMQRKMASKQQASPSCATGIPFIEFLLDKSEGRLHCSTSSAIEWCENYLNSCKTLGGVLTRLKKCQKKKAEQNRAACMHSCMLRKTILSSSSALLSGLDHFHNGFEVSFDL